MTIEKDKVVVIETNIDDMVPLAFEHVEEVLFRNGALDVFIENIQMKKNRPAFKLSCIVPVELKEKIATLILEETTTSGVRLYEVERYKLPRKNEKMDTIYGQVNIKIFTLPSGQTRKIPEYDDCRRIARENNKSFLTIYKDIIKIV